MSTSSAEFIVTLTPWGKRRWHLVRVIIINEVSNRNTPWTRGPIHAGFRPALMSPELRLPTASLVCSSPPIYAMNDQWFVSP